MFMFLIPVLLGCAFCQFKTKEAADKCIAVAQDEAEVTCNLTHCSSAFLFCVMMCLKCCFCVCRRMVAFVWMAGSS